MASLSTRFGKKSFGIVSKDPLDNEKLFNVAPSIFAQDKHLSRSERYTYIPTIEVIEGLRQNGFFPFMAAQSRSRIEGKEAFTKHMLRFRPDGQVTSPEAFEIIMINSHDGTSSYQMMAGVFRFVCMNGMVLGDVMEDIRIPHKGNITDNVVDAAFRILDQNELALESIDNMKSVQLLPGEQEVLAAAALNLKYEKDEAPIAAHQLLSPRRFEDRGKGDLWSSFNRIQENLMKGGLQGQTATGKNTSTRAVRSIDNNIKLNESLWILADRMAELKAR